MSFVVEAIWRRWLRSRDRRMSPVEASMTIAALAPTRRGAPDGDWAAAPGDNRSSASTAPSSATRAVTVRA